MKAKLAALMAGAAALGHDVITELMASLKPSEQVRRKRRHSHKTRMSRGLGRALDRARIAAPPPTPGKLNFRRSDPRHPKHSAIYHGGEKCSCGSEAPLAARAE